jgi:hypothetical protein
VAGWSYRSPIIRSSCAITSIARCSNADSVDSQRSAAEKKAAQLVGGRGIERPAQVALPVPLELEKHAQDGHHAVPGAAQHSDHAQPPDLCGTVQAVAVVRIARHPDQIVPLPVAQRVVGVVNEVGLGELAVAAGAARDRRHKAPMLVEADGIGVNADRFGYFGRVEDTRFHTAPRWKTKAQHQRPRTHILDHNDSTRARFYKSPASCIAGHDWLSSADRQYAISARIDSTKPLATRSIVARLCRFLL